MIQHLPEDVLWCVIQHANDVKTCVSLWSCCSEVYKTYNKEKFWRNMLYYYFNISKQTHISSTSWLNIFWQTYAKENGCSYCRKPFSQNKNYNETDTVQLAGINMYVCSTCKNTLGECMIHKKQIEHWQSQLLRKLKNLKGASILFENYFGINQIQHSHSYKTKCITCFKNIRNCLCPHFKCGACCGCKFHKSHYKQILIHDESMHILLRASSHKKRRIIAI
jgi:hypothetical protein